MSVLSDLISSPTIWNVIQHVLGAPDFKKQLYSAVLGPSGRLLDFGCANGHIADVFLRYEYYGLDLDPRAIKRAAEVFRAHANMHFLCADIRTRPFSEGYFDQVLFAGTIHHLDERQLSDVLVEMQRLLKPGGTIHIVEPVRQASDGWQPRLLRWLDRGRHPRNLKQIKEAVEATNGLEPGIATLHRPYGALIQDCDFVHLPVRKVE
jgi:SAM-dependent methyltransferase